MLKSISWFVPVGAFVLVQACGGSIDGGVPAPSEDSTAAVQERFVGDWTISFITGRDSSAMFTLDPSGEISVFRRGDGTPLDAIAAKSDSSLRCGVGTRWHSASESVLVLEGVCSDGAKRDVRIAFVTDRSRNTTDALLAEVTSVGGETGWQATEFNGPWHLQRCTTPRCER